nr:hypothetical protein [uncultured Desulfobacter sp.]
MNKQIDFKTAVDIFLREVSPDTGHLPLESIYRLSLENGLKNATEEELHHLWQCRTCLEKWETISIALDTNQDKNQDNNRDAFETEDPYLSFGTLKAAATDAVEPMHLKSNCRRFELSIHPSPGNPAKGLVTLNITEEPASMDGMRVLVRDAANETVLDKTIVGGRAAVKREDLNQLDLSSWTISFTKGRKTDADT